MRRLENTAMNGSRSDVTRRTGCLHEVNLSDLLEREIVPLQSAEAQALLKNQVILVTGAAGSIGSELCRQLLDYKPELVIALDTNETGLFDLAESLRHHPRAANLYPYIGDIRDAQEMSRLFTKVHPRIVFHAAAYKHVPLMEQFPDQAVHTNALATYHLCRLAGERGVDRFIFVSTDKAAAPVSILGASKRVGELVVQSLAQMESYQTRFCAVRFGNVIGSRGSVVPLFARQIESGGPVTVTDPEATRYFMTIPEACGLVITTAERLHETLVASDEELVSTVHNKIFSVVYTCDIPAPSTIMQWMLSLDEALQSDRMAQLRDCLFEMVQVHELIAAN